MGDKQITFLLQPCFARGLQHFEIMAGQIEFISEIKIDKGITYDLGPYELDNLYGEVRHQGTQAIVNDVM